MDTPLLPAYTNPERRERLLRKYHMITRCDYARLTPMERWRFEQAYTRMLVNSTRYYSIDNGSMIKSLFHYLDKGDITRYEAVLHDMFDISDWPAEYKARMIERAHEYVALRREVATINIDAREGWRNYRDASAEALSIQDKTLRELMDAFFARRSTRQVQVFYAGDSTPSANTPTIQMNLFEAA